MERLRDRDLRAILAFLRDTYAQPDLDANRRWVVERVTRVVGAERVSYNEVHARRGTLRMLISPADDIPPLTARVFLGRKALRSSGDVFARGIPRIPYAVTQIQ